MDILRYTNPPQMEREQFKIIKPPPQPGFDDSVTTIKETPSANISQNPSRQPSPTEDVVINFHSTENVVAETQANARTNTIEANLLSRTTTMGNGIGEGNPTLADEGDPVDLIDDSVLLRIINNLMFYILRINTISLVVLGLLTLTITWDLTYLYSIGFLWLVDLFELLQMLKHSTKFRNNTQGTLKKIWLFLGPITKTITYAGSKGLLVLYISYQPLELSLTTCVAPAAIYEIISSFGSVWNAKQKTMRRVHLAFLVVKCLMISAIICVILKAEGQLLWNWREVFLGYWVLLGILCGLTVVAVLCVVNRCCVFFFAESEQFQVHGVIWALFILGGKAVLSCNLVIALRGIFEKNLSIETFVSPFFMIMSYNLTMLLFTLGYYNEIECFFKTAVAVQDETEATQTMGFDTKENHPKKNQKIVVPKFLTKSSSTYYRISTEHELKEVKEKRKKRKAKLMAKQKAKGKELAKEPAKTTKEPAKRIVREKLKSVDYTNVKQSSTATNSSPKHPHPDMLITIAETDQDKATLATDIDKRSMMSNNRADKGKDFFSSLTNRTGVLGIVPSVVRRLGLDKKGKQGYEEQEDQEEEEDYDRNYGHMSYDVARRSAFDSKREEGNPGNIQLRKTGRGQLEGNVLRELEEKVRKLEAKGRMSKKDRMAQSLYIKPQTDGNLNLSGEHEHEHQEPPSNDSSFVDEAHKAPSGDNSMTQQCLICFDTQPDAVFMDCGHGGVCYECAVEIWKAAGECYLCRNKIVQVLQIDLKSKLGGDVIKVLSSTQMINWEGA